MNAYAAAPAAPAKSNTLFFASGNLVKGHQPRQYFAKKTDGEGNERSVLVVEGMPVFRSGTFRDSMGSQRTWEDLHMQQFVQHFDVLRERGIFSDVPVRNGHPMFLGNPNDQVIGWMSKLVAEKMRSEHDGQEYTFLLADYEILDEDAAKKIDSGLWRNRSAEVGFYITNDEAEYFPVFMGFAYVDIPAVEGLNTAASLNSKFDHNKYTLISEEAPVGDNDGKTPAQRMAEGLSPASGMHAAGGAGIASQATQALPAPQVFSIGGQQVTDPVKVQEALTNYERQLLAKDEALKVVRDTGIEEFVKGLAGGESPKLLASQIDSQTAFAKSLNDEQLTAWKASFDAAPAVPLFEKHGATQGTDGQHRTASAQQQADKPEGPDRLADDKQTLIELGRTGMTKDQLKATSAYSRILAVEPTFQL